MRSHQRGQHQLDAALHWQERLGGKAQAAHSSALPQPRMEPKAKYLPPLVYQLPTLCLKMVHTPLRGARLASVDFVPGLRQVPHDSD